MVGQLLREAACGQLRPEAARGSEPGLLSKYNAPCKTLLGQNPSAKRNASASWPLTDLSP